MVQRFLTKKQVCVSVLPSFREILNGTLGIDQISLSDQENKWLLLTFAWHVHLF